MADFIKTNEIQTRISLKYDSYEKWTSKNPVLLKGEVAIATIPAGANTNPAMQNLPNVVMKVGDGTSQYNALPFVSALAADVYEWAKAANKPSYDISEISSALEYRLATIDGANHKYALQARKAGSEESWNNVADSAIDLSGLVASVADHESRISVVEGDLNTAETGLKARMTAAEQAIEGITKGDGGAIGVAINEKIQSLDANVSQTAGADGLALNVVEVDGVITSISGSIAANTYDAYGSAAAVRGETTETVASAYALASSKATLDEVKAEVKKEEDARKAAIQALDYDGYEAGNAEGKTISFVGTVSESDGVISATKRDLVFTDAYSESNPAATKKYVDDAVLSGVADLNGAMHFEGVKEALPELTGEHGYQNGDVVIVGITEYVYSNGEWVQLGDEGALAAALQALTLDETGAEDKTLIISQSNGKVSAEAKAIKIAQSQVTNLTTDLGNKLEASAFNTFKTNEFAPVKTAVDNMSTTIANQINALDADKSQDAGVDGLALRVVQENGVITSISGSIAANTYDAYGAAAAVQGETTHTVAEAYALADAAQTADEVTAAINGRIQALDNSDAAVDGEFVTAAVQTDGTVAVSRAKVNVKHLAQDENSYVVFNCGTSEINI